MPHESFLAVFTLYLIAGMFSMSIAIALAHVKHRTWVMWGVLCLFFPPFVVWLYLLPRRAEPAPYEKESEGWFDAHGRDKAGWWN
jgi:hypothetical protein